jgi:hypothetical protein
MEKMENFLAIVGSDAEFWDLETIYSKELGANLVQ